MKRLAICLVSLVLFILLLTLTPHLLHPRLDSRDVIDLQTKPATNENAIVISGLAAHSGYSVNEIRFRTDGGAINVDLFLVRASLAPSGSFEFTVYLSPQTKVVRFGKDRRTIWVRP